MGSHDIAIIKSDQPFKPAYGVGPIPIAFKNFVPGKLGLLISFPVVKKPYNAYFLAPDEISGIRLGNSPVEL